MGRCSVPPLVINAGFGTVDTTADHNVTYNCFAGHVFPNLSPTITIMCQQDLTWQTAPPPCQGSIYAIVFDGFR